MEPELLPIEVE